MGHHSWVNLACDNNSYGQLDVYVELEVHGLWTYKVLIHFVTRVEDGHVVVLLLRQPRPLFGGDVLG